MIGWLAKRCGLRLTSIGFRWWLGQGSLKHWPRRKRWVRYVHLQIGEQARSISPDIAWTLRVLHLHLWWQRKAYR